jgi:hypothetical protein
MADSSFPFHLWKSSWLLTARVCLSAASFNAATPADTDQQAEGKPFECHLLSPLVDQPHPHSQQAIRYMTAIAAAMNLRLNRFDTAPQRRGSLTINSGRVAGQQPNRAADTGLTLLLTTDTGQVIALPGLPDMCLAGYR